MPIIKYTVPNDTKSWRSKRMLVIVLIIGLVAAGVGAYRWYFSPEREFAKLIKPWGAPSPVPSPEELARIRDKAEAGDAESQLYMGVFYANGDGVPQNYATAAEWYEKAAEQGNARAQRNLAVLYDCGVGVKRDYKYALELYMKAAESNDPAAHLGVSMYLLTFRRSLFPGWKSSANSWMIKACYMVWDKFKKNFSSKLDELRKKYNLLHDRAVFSFVTDRFLKIDNELKTHLNFWNQYNYGESYFQSESSIALEVFRMAAAGDSEAQLRLGILSLHGQGATTSLNGSWPTYWMRKAAGNGNQRAAFILAVPRDLLYTLSVLKIHDLEMSDNTRIAILKSVAESGEEDYFEDIYTRAAQMMSMIMDKLLLSREDAFSVRMELARKGQSESMYEMIHKHGNLSDYIEFVKKDALDENAEAIRLLFENELCNYSYGINFAKADEWLVLLFKNPNTIELNILSQSIMDIDKKANISEGIEIIKQYEQRAKNGSRLAQSLLGLVALEEKRYTDALEYFLLAKSDDIPILFYYIGMLARKIQFESKNQKDTQNIIDNNIMDIGTIKKPEYYFLKGMKTLNIPSCLEYRKTMRYDIKNISDDILCLFHNNKWYLYKSSYENISSSADEILGLYYYLLPILYYQ